MNHSLKFDFAVRKPRIAVLGLNPHAGDNSLLGTEEAEKITPAIQKAQQEGILAFGPFPADGFFGAGSFTNFDGILAMYHDQGSDPVQGIVIRYRCKFYCRSAVYKDITCPWNCLSIAGKGEASENSFRQAIYLACDIYQKQADV